MSGDFVDHSRTHCPQTPFPFPSKGGAEPNSDSVRPEKLGRVRKDASEVGKSPNSLCSNYAVLNGRNPGGVRDCVFLGHPQARDTTKDGQSESCVRDRINLTRIPGPTARG